MAPPHHRHRRRLGHGPPPPQGDLPLRLRHFDGAGEGGREGDDGVGPAAHELRDPVPERRRVQPVNLLALVRIAAIETVAQDLLDGRGRKAKGICTCKVHTCMLISGSITSIK